jgi:hypothetical protein
MKKGVRQFIIKRTVSRLDLGQRQQLAIEASQSAARLNAVFKRRREAWDAKAER